MDIFGIGLAEMLLILVIALLVFGPGKLPEIGAALGRALGDFRRATRELTSDLQQSVAEARTEIEKAAGQATPGDTPSGTTAPTQGQGAAVNDADEKWLQLGMASDDGAKTQ